MKIEELSMLLIRMAIQSNDFIKLHSSQIATAAIYAAINLVKASKLYNNDKFYISFMKQLLVTSKTQYKLEFVEGIAKSLMEFY
jgi:hypothetical protein